MEDTLLSILWCLTVMIMLTVNSILIFVVYMKLNYLQGALEGICSSLGLQSPAKPKRLRDIFREPKPRQDIVELRPKTVEETS